MVHNKPVKDGKIRSFNLSMNAIEKLERGAQIEGVSRSAYVERLIISNDHSMRVKKDIEKGLQTTLAAKPTPPRPIVSTMCAVCMTDNHTNGHVQWISTNGFGQWKLVCPNEVKE